MKLFFSNSIDVLADSLRDVLFRAGLPPLVRRTVIVPSEHVKHTLQMRWAHDPTLNVVCAVRFLPMSQALADFFSLPSALELSLKIESCLKDIDDPHIKVLSTGEKYRSFCDHLSQLFLRYFAYESKIEGWQQELWDRVWPPLPAKTSADPLFLFCPSFLPPRFKKFFEKEAAALFAPSPSEQYWGDVLAPKEQLFLPHLEEYFAEQHPLLTHFGRVAREFEKSFSTAAVSKYAAPKKKHLLAHVQKSLLHLTPLSLDIQGGIEVHAAPSKRREVEIVLERISQLKVPEHEILVLAPDISEYAPYIHMVFAGRCDYTIYDLPLDADSSVASCVRALLHIVDHQLAPASVQSLLACTPFLQKFSLEIADVEKIEMWIEKVHLPWNIFFQQALTEILEGGDSVFAIEDLELLDKWKQITALLEKFLVPLIENQTKSVKEWMVFLQEMITSLFFVLQEDEPLLRYLRSAAKIEAGLFAWESIERVLQEMMHRKSAAFQTSHLSSVRFASLRPVLAPSVVIVMGMEEGNFPRKEKKSSLAFKDGSYRPTSSDEDRHLFLQLLFTTREKLIFTYGAIDADDGKAVPPSIVIAELLKMLPQLSITHHMPRPYPSKRAKKDLPVIVPSENVTIDVRHLKLLARHPIEFYLQRAMGLYFDRHIPSLVSHFDLADARRASLKESANAIAQRMQTQGKLPLPPFREVSLRKVIDEVESYQKALRTWGIDHIFSVDMRDGCDEVIKKSTGEWIVPALEIEGTKIIGKITDLTPKGLLFSGSHTYPDCLKAWPLLLVLHHLPLDISKQLLFVHDGTQKMLTHPDPTTALKKYIAYYKQAMQKPSPFLPSIAKNILSEEKSKLGEDPIIDWFLDHFNWPDENAWRPLLRETFDAI